MRGAVPTIAMAAVSAATLTIGAAQAQEPLDPVPSKYAEAYLAEFADCVVAQKSYVPKVTAFLRTVPNSSGFYEAAMKATDMRCLDSSAKRSNSRTLQMRLQPSTMRDAFYSALYRRDFGRIGPVEGISAVPPMTLSPEFDGPASALPPEYRPGRAFGDCVARAAPQHAHAMVVARPYAAAEDTAVKELKPAIAACLPEGQTIRLTRPAVRAYLGEAMYKLSVAARAKLVRPTY